MDLCTESLTDPILQLLAEDLEDSLFPRPACILTIWQIDTFQQKTSKSRQNLLALQRPILKQF